MTNDENYVQVKKYIIEQSDHISFPIIQFKREYKNDLENYKDIQLNSDKMIMTRNDAKRWCTWAFSLYQFYIKVRNNTPRTIKETFEDMIIYFKSTQYRIFEELCVHLQSLTNEQVLKVAIENSKLQINEIDIVSLEETVSGLMYIIDKFVYFQPQLLPITSISYVPYMLGMLLKLSFYSMSWCEDNLLLLHHTIACIIVDIFTDRIGTLLFVDDNYNINDIAKQKMMKYFSEFPELKKITGPESLGYVISNERINQLEYFATLQESEECQMYPYILWYRFSSPLVRIKYAYSNIKESLDRGKFNLSENYNLELPDPDEMINILKFLKNSCVYGIYEQKSVVHCLCKLLPFYFNKVNEFE